jgi:hypothetical protein
MASGHRDGQSSGRPVVRPVVAGFRSAPAQQP